MPNADAIEAPCGCGKPWASLVGLKVLCTSPMSNGETRSRVNVSFDCIFCGPSVVPYTFQGYDLGEEGQDLLDAAHELGEQNRSHVLNEYKIRPHWKRTK